jgi:hypothetical protein
LNLIIATFKNDKADINKEDYLSLLRLQAKCELNIYSDKRYIETLNIISGLSKHLNDKLIYVHQLIKEKEYRVAHDEYKVLRQSNLILSILSAKQNKNKLLDICELFYRDYSLYLLKETLTSEAQRFTFSKEGTLRVKSFINELFNVKLYEKKSNRKDHKPSYLSYPNISEEPYIDFTLKSNIELGSLLESIKVEVLHILEQRAGTPYVKNIPGVPAGFEHLIGNKDWRSVDIYASGELLVDRGKTLVSLLKKHFDLADCPPLSPEVMISILEPGTHITPHYGTSNIKHTLHIPILLPEGDLGIKVGGVLKHWKYGECLLFDDSFKHEAWNNTNSTRIVLIVDIWHNELSTTEKNFLKKIMPMIVNWRSNLNN